MGSPGATGPQGVAGPTGPGAPTSTVLVASHLRCSKVVGQFFEYDTTLYTNGMRFVECAVADSFVAITATALYGADQNGSITGGCLVGYDVDTNSSGFWNFTLSPLRAQYNDTGSANDQSVVTFAPGDCD